MGPSSSTNASPEECLCDYDDDALIKPDTNEIVMLSLGSASSGTTRCNSSSSMELLSRGVASPETTQRKSSMELLPLGPLPTEASMEPLSYDLQVNDDLLDEWEQVF